MAYATFSKRVNRYFFKVLQTRDKTNQGLVASMIGEGSVLLIISFAAVSACVVEGLYILKKKRQYKDEANNQAENGK